jgi:hypothetical protein
MNTIGQIEKHTQARVVALFRDRLCYDYLGDKTDLFVRPGTSAEQRQAVLLRWHREQIKALVVRSTKTNT